MNQIVELYNDFFEINPHDYIAMINFIEKNYILFENKTKFDDKEDFDNYNLIMSQYILSLESLGKYKKSSEYARKMLKLIELNADIFGINLFEYSYFISIMTTKGRSHFYIKEYDKSILIFSELYNYDKENDNFKDWLISSKKRKRNSYINYLYIIALILIFTELFLSDKINSKVGLFMDIIGLLFLLAAFFMEYFLDKLLVRINKNK